MAKATSSLVIDDTSLLLLIFIVSILLISALAARWFQPTIHPLILGRQADTSQVHAKDESPVYRNVNAPHGFELASKPNKKVADVAAILGEATHRRSVYGKEKSNKDLVTEARQFAAGLSAATGRSDSASLAICVDSDTWESTVAILAASLATSSSLQALVVPPLHLPEGQPRQLPTDKPQLSAVLTTPAAIHKAIAMAIVTPDTLFVLENQEQASLAQRNLQGSRSVKITTYREILEQGSKSSATSSESAAADATVASFWIGSQWTNVSNRALTAGVTTYLSFYPPDKIPAERDSVYVEQTVFLSSPSLHLGAAATPAGLALALTALHTGSALQAGPLTSSLSDPNPTTSTALAKAKPTIIYASPAGASSLGLSLTALSKKTPFSKLIYAGKLRTLRYGALRTDSIYDAILFDSVKRQNAVASVRALTIVGQGWVVPQRLLDVLRAHLGVPIMNSFLPAAPLRTLSASSSSSSSSSSSPTDVTSVWTTAPLTSSHAYDLQAFKANNNLSEIPAHVGPPAVSVEIKTTRQGGEASPRDKTPHGWERFSSKDDFIGRVAVRGNILTSSHNEWYTVPITVNATTADGQDQADEENQEFTHGLFRTNGTLLVLPPSIHAEKKEMVAIPTMSAKYPIKGKNKIGSGADEDVRDAEKGESKKRR